MSPYAIVLADDHAMVRQGIKRILEEERGLQVVAEVSDGLELLELLPSLSVDMVIMDIGMPSLSGIEATKSIKQSRPEIKVLILTMHKSNEFLNLAFSAGADGYLLKEDVAKELLAAIEKIRHDSTYISPLLAPFVADFYVRSRRKELPKSPYDLLTKREIEILKLIAQGKSGKEIAELLFLSHRTVQNHRTSILRKLKLHKSTDLVKYALLHGIF